MNRRRNRQLLLVDVILLVMAPYLLYSLRFEGVRWPVHQLHNAAVFALISVPVRILIYYGLGVYRTLWRYASIAEMELIGVASIAGSVVVAVLGASVFPAIGWTDGRVPLSVLFNSGVLSVLTLAAPRLLIRAGGWHALRRQLEKSSRRVLIAAGTAGQMILKEMTSNAELDMLPLGFVDDDPAKRGLRIGNRPIFGTLAQIPEIIARERITEVVIAMPTAAGTVVRGVVQAALAAGAKTRTMPSLGEIISGELSVTTLRKVEIHDLLRREPIKTDMRQVAMLAHDHTVLVTGAGGSIGSELCRQLAALGPSKVVLLGHGENPIFEILNELRKKHTGVDFTPVIADIRDVRRVREIFEAHRPHAVFHAAAHKHVPLMEGNVVEAVTNNVLGTKNIVDASAEFGRNTLCSFPPTKRWPTNVMGVKRVAEHVVRRAALKSGQNFMVVRFGNVLGSRGSVVPTFVRQIQEGGPVTVTHPEMRRFFMTIPEAVQLVLQAATLGKGGELFMLDMGEPVKVVDLARDLIRLSGLKEGEDIDIQFTGIRPGEKLYEEMFFSDELAERTDHPKVLRARKEKMETWGDHLIDQLIQNAQRGESPDNLRSMLRVIVPDFNADAPPPMMPTPQLWRGHGSWSGRQRDHGGESERTAAGAYMKSSATFRALAATATLSLVTLAACDGAGHGLQPDSTGVDSLAYIDTIPNAAADYVVAQDLTTALGAPISSYILNDSGHVAGIVGADTSVAGNIAHAFLWTPAGATSLHDDGCLGVQDFNNNDQVVCVDTTVAGKVGVWQNGHVSAIPALQSGGPYSGVSLRINDSGALAGVLTSSVCPSSCVVRVVADSVAVLYKPATDFKSVRLNTRGDFLTQGSRDVGSYEGTDFVFQAGADSAIGHNVGVNGGLVDMNDDGTTVGSLYNHGAAIDHDILVIVNGQAVSIGGGYALGVNNSGAVVGLLQYAVNPEAVNAQVYSAPYLWNGNIALLGHAIATPGWTLKEPVAINNAGSMLVIADDSSASRFGDLVLLTHN